MTSPEYQPGTFEEITAGLPEMDFASARKESPETQRSFFLLDQPFFQDIILETGDGERTFQMQPMERASEERYLGFILCKDISPTPLSGLGEHGFFFFQRTFKIDDQENPMLAGRLYKDHHFGYRPVQEVKRSLFRGRDTFVRKIAGATHMFAPTDEVLAGPAVKGLKIKGADNNKTVTIF